MSDDAVDADLMIRRAIGGHAEAISWIVEQADTSRHAALIAMAALLDQQSARIDHAREVATTSRDRQLVAIAGAHLKGEHELVDALARDHLVDYPDSLIVAWIASDAAGRSRSGRDREL
jgi:hypothetical protein